MRIIKYIFTIMCNSIFLGINIISFILCVTTDIIKSFYPEFVIDIKWYYYFIVLVISVLYRQAKINIDQTSDVAISICEKRTKLMSVGDGSVILELNIHNKTIIDDALRSIVVRYSSKNKEENIFDTRKCIFTKSPISKDMNDLKKHIKEGRDDVVFPHELSGGKINTMYITIPFDSNKIVDKESYFMNEKHAVFELEIELMNNIINKRFSYRKQSILDKINEHAENKNIEIDF